MSIDIDLLESYFNKRKNKDGGYCFYGLNESNLLDTYLAVQTLNLIGRLDRDKNTITYLRSFIENDGSFYGLYVARYVLRSLKAFGVEMPEGSQGYAKSLYLSVKPGDERHMESESMFESVYALSDLLKALNMHEYQGALGEVMLKYEQKDGGFGVIDPTLASTYHAIRVLNNGGLSPSFPSKTVQWVKSRALTGGGFTKTPETGLAFIDDTYHALQILGLIGEAPDNAVTTARFITSCQNENGGFRRAAASGISGFETSYQAVMSLKVLLSL